jgi:hypothetical protein
MSQKVEPFKDKLKKFEPGVSDYEKKTVTKIKILITVDFVPA